jgi:hypothetical protein
MYMIDFYPNILFVQTCWPFYFRPYLWGEKCQEYHSVKKMLGSTLCKQPTTEDVLDLLDKSRLQQSLVDFPLGRSVKVLFVVYSFFCCCILAWSIFSCSV